MIDVSEPGAVCVGGGAFFVDGKERGTGLRRVVEGEVLGLSKVLPDKLLVDAVHVARVVLKVDDAVQQFLCTCQIAHRALVLLEISGDLIELFEKKKVELKYNSVSWYIDAGL